MHHFDLYGWYTTEQLPGRDTDIAPDNTSETTTDGELRANFTGYEWIDLPYSPPPPMVQPTPEVPQSVSMRQARLALLGAGLLGNVDAAIAAQEEPIRSHIQIEWDYATEIDRKWPTLLALSAALGLTPNQLDDLFITASQL